MSDDEDLRYSALDNVMQTNVAQNFTQQAQRAKVTEQNNAKAIQSMRS